MRRLTLPSSRAKDPLIMPEFVHILILPEGKHVYATQGALLSDVLGKHGVLPGPCGGKGLCGKCIVEVTVHDQTTRVLACQTRATTDLTVRHANQAAMKIVIEGDQPRFAPAAADSNRPNSAPQLAVAFDIGTTTLACALLDLTTGARLAVCGMENPQSAFGADVMTRLLAALEHGGSALQTAVLSGLRLLVDDACNRVNVSADQIVLYTAVGNSAMQHLLLGRDPTPLTRAPYQPVSTDSVTLNAALLGLPAGQTTTFCFLPLIAGFVGADTTACLLATDFDRQPGVSLLIDIGTNGELVLGSGTNRIACSAAAGPAFEGASLTCGMRAQEGAIDGVFLRHNGIRLSVIGNAKPGGICGSGLIALVARLLETGTLDKSGRFDPSGTLGASIATWNGQKAFTVAKETESATGAPILLTQKDVRALQLAKAAIATGMELLCRAYGIRTEQIDRVLLAGGFGSTLDIFSACAIGLLPQAISDRVQIVGNASLTGAALAACSDEARAHAARLAASTKHLALIDAPDFNDRFMDALAFPAYFDKNGAGQ